MDLAELGEEVRIQALRRKRRGNTHPTADEAGILSVPEFQATRRWPDVAPLYMKGGGKWRAGGGRKEGGGGTNKATGGGKRGGGRGV